MSEEKPKIIQILITPDNALWQNVLIGLGDDGVVYEVSDHTRWRPMVPPIGYEEENNGNNERSEG